VQYNISDVGNVGRQATFVFSLYLFECMYLTVSPSPFAEMACLASLSIGLVSNWISSIKTSTRHTGVALWQFFF